MNTMKKCLFGGALVGAGLCSTAVAGEFQWGSSNISDNRINVYPGSLFSFGTSGGWNESLSNSPSYASTVGGDLGIDILAYSGIAQGAYGNANVRHYGLDFTVSDNMMATINWDVSNDNYGNGAGYSYAYITDSGGGNIFSMNGSPATGTTSLTLSSTETYTFRAWIISGPGISGLSFFNMTENTVSVVPLPPAAFAGLGMLAGLGAYRRIRR